MKHWHNKLCNCLEHGHLSLCTYLDTIQSKQFQGRTPYLMNIIPSMFSQVTSHNIHQIPKHQGDLNIQDSCTKRKLKRKILSLADQHNWHVTILSMCRIKFYFRNTWELIQAYHNCPNESKELRFDKFPQDVPFELGHRVFGYNFHGGVVIHICLAVSYMAKQSTRDSEHRWSQDELQSHSRGFGFSGGRLADRSLSEAPNTPDGISRLLWGAVSIRSWRYIPPGYDKEY